MRRLLVPAALLVAGFPLASAGAELTPEEVRKVLAHSPLPPPPADETNAVGGDPAAARLGQFLFFETRLSGSGTPSLRNVATTAPYMHRGQFATLEDVLHHYSTVDPPPLSNAALETLLRPLRLTDREIADLVAFLDSLTDTSIDPGLLAKPAAPTGP